MSNYIVEKTFELNGKALKAIIRRNYFIRDSFVFEIFDVNDGSNIDRYYMYDELEIEWQHREQYEEVGTELLARFIKMKAFL